MLLVLGSQSLKDFHAKYVQCPNMKMGLCCESLQVHAQHCAEGIWLTAGTERALHSIRPFTSIGMKLLAELNA